jgi:hypothetical protein
LAERALCLEPDRHASRSSQVTGLQKNPDSSVDLHIGPHSPPGKDELDSEKKAGGSFEAILRFYGPEKTFLDKVWTLGDIEEVKP